MPKYVRTTYLAGDELLRMEHAAVRPGADLVDDGRLKVDEDGPWDVLAGLCLREEGVVGTVFDAECVVGWHQTVGLDAVLEGVELPATMQKRPCA